MTCDCTACVVAFLAKWGGWIGIVVLTLIVGAVRYVAGPHRK